MYFCIVKLRATKTSHIMKILKTKSYYFGVELSADNSINITAEYQHIGNGKWINCHSMPWPDATALIGSIGGIDKVLERCEEVEDLAALVEGRNAANAASRERQKAADAEKAQNKYLRISEEYAAAFVGKKVVESTLGNIAILLKYLNTMNWGVWELPAMTIGYSCNQYDCDGKTAVTIKLDEPVKGYTKLSIGAPRGHLTAYTNIERAILLTEE